VRCRIKSSTTTGWRNDARIYIYIYVRRVPACHISSCVHHTICVLIYVSFISINAIRSLIKYYDSALERGRARTRNSLERIQAARRNSVQVAWNTNWHESLHGNRLNIEPRVLWNALLTERIPVSRGIIIWELVYGNKGKRRNIAEYDATYIRNARAIIFINKNVRKKWYVGSDEIDLSLLLPRTAPRLANYISCMESH